MTMVAGQYVYETCWEQQITIFLNYILILLFGFLEMCIASQVGHLFFQAEH